MELKKLILVYEENGKEIPVELEGEELDPIIELFNQASYYLIAHNFDLYEYLINKINKIIGAKIKAMDQ